MLRASKLPTYPEGPKTTEPIVFIDADLEGIQLLYDDAVVIIAKISDSTVKRLIVDTGSSCDVLFLATFQLMGIDMKQLEAIPQDPGRLHESGSPDIGLNQFALSPWRGTQEVDNGGGILNH